MARASSVPAPPRGALAVIVVLVAWTPSAVWAQGSEEAPTVDEQPVPPEVVREARALFELAHTHYDAGRYEEAAREFQRAYDLMPRPELLYNLHLAHRDAGRVEEAVDALRRFLAEASEVSPGTRRTLEQRLVEMEAQLTERGEAEATGATDTGPGEPEQVAERDSSAGSTQEPARALSRGGGLPPWIGGVLVGLGGLALGVAAIEAAVAHGALGERDAACTSGASGMECPADFDQQPLVDRFTLHRDVGYALLGVGLGVAAIGAALLAIAIASEGAVSASAACTLDGCVATAQGRF